MEMFFDAFCLIGCIVLSLLILGIPIAALLNYLMAIEEKKVNKNE